MQKSDGNFDGIITIIKIIIMQTIILITNTVYMVKPCITRDKNVLSMFIDSSINAVITNELFLISKFNRNIASYAHQYL